MLKKGDKLRQPKNVKLSKVDDDNTAVKLTWQYDLANAGEKGKFSSPDWFDIRIGHDRQFVTGLGELLERKDQAWGNNTREIIIRFSELSCKHRKGQQANEDTINSGACMCGTEACLLNKGFQYCDASANYCSRQPSNNNATSSNTMTRRQRRLSGALRNASKAHYYTNYSVHTLWLQNLPTYISVRAHSDNPEVMSPWSESTEAWPLAESCGDGSFLNTATSKNPASWVCEECPQGAACRGRTVWEDVRAEWGWWRVPWALDKNSMFEQCPFDDDCKGFTQQLVDDESDKNVSEDASGKRDDASATMLADPDFRMQDVEEGCTKGTEGVLCNACARGYIREGLACVECSEEGFGLCLAIVFTVAILVGLLVSLCKRRLKIGRLKLYRVLWRDILRILSINVTFAQIGSSLSNVIDVDWPPNFLKFLNNLDFVNIDFMSLIGASCVGVSFSF